MPRSCVIELVTQHQAPTAPGNSATRPCRSPSRPRPLGLRAQGFFRIDAGREATRVDAKAGACGMKD